MITAELDTSTIEITNSIGNIALDNTNTIAGYDNSYNVDIEDLSDLDITVAKKEYTIVGDDIYIPQLYDDAPQWMKDLVGLVVDVSMTTNSTKLINDMNAMLQEFAVSYVPLNQYTQSILDLGNEDMRLNALIETLNSNFSNGLSNANAQIINLQMTKASKDEVVAQVIQTLAAQLANPDSNLGATVVRLDQAIVAEQTARATSFQALTASIESIDGSITANAEVLENALAYVGIDEAGASTNTGLSAYLEASDGTIGGADSQLANTIRVTAEGVESKWAYNSIVNINGVYTKSGFGLTAFSGNGTQANPSTSEFWIDATKLRFTNSANTGRTAPFTIDASGATPQITFNGKVSFSNVTGAPGGGSNLLYNSAPMIANETKGWSVGWYNTGIAPVLGAGSDPWRPSGGGSVYAVVPGAPTVGTVFDVSQTTKVPVVGGTWYEASAYTSSHRCTSYVTIAWYDSSNTYITEVGGSQTAIASSGALSNWSRSTLLAQAPANAARAQFYVRSIVSGTDSYCFIAFAYLGKAVPGQVVFSDWSEGTSAGVSSGEVVNDINSGNTTTIDGGKITTGTITAAQIAARAITADRLNVSSLSALTADLGTITSGVIYDSSWNGYSYRMKIDLANGSIHII